MEMEMEMEMKMKMEAEGKRKRSSIVLYPSPGRNHLNPVVELGKLLTKQLPTSSSSTSISVTIITSCQTHDDTSALQSYTCKVSSANPSINFIHLPPPPPAQNGDVDPHLTNPLYNTHEHVATLFELPRLNNPSLRETLLELSKTSNIKALVIDFFCSFASQVSSDLSIPTYYFRTQGAFHAAVLLHCPTMDKSIPRSLKDDDDVLVHVPGAPPIPSKDMPVVLRDRSHRVYQYLMEGSAQMRKSKGIILNTFEALESPMLQAMAEDKCPPVYCVGPLVSSASGVRKEKEKEECLSWLDSQPSASVLFLCFGRFGELSRRQLREMAIGLEKSGVRFLWVVRNDDHIHDDDGDLETLFPEGFLERTKGRGLIVKMWAPQMEVLNHGSVGGFVSHCGWSSVMEAVCAGVPILAWPIYAEQKMNRVYLVEGIKVAIGIQQQEQNDDEDGYFVTAQELEERIMELMMMMKYSERGKVVRQNAMDMKQAAHFATTEGGSSPLALANLLHSLLLLHL